MGFIPYPPSPSIPTTQDPALPRARIVEIGRPVDDARSVVLPPAGIGHNYGLLLAVGGHTSDQPPEQIDSLTDRGASRSRQGRLEACVVALFSPALPIDVQLRPGGGERCGRGNPRGP
jgi:hypothetical protein